MRREWMFWLGMLVVAFGAACRTTDSAQPNVVDASGGQRATGAVFRHMDMQQSDTSVEFAYASLERSLGAEAEGTLSADRAVVLSATGSMKAMGTTGDPEEMAVWAWIWLRLGPDAVPINKPLNAFQIQKEAAEHGLLNVRSDPPAASVTVDGVTVKPTNTRVYARAGRRVVRVTKSGLQPAQQNCDVKAKGTFTFSAVLTDRKSTAECVQVK